MPKQISLIRIFVASPSDVLEERRTIRKVAEEYNKGAALLSNYKIEIVGWETDTYPSIGLYAQDVINKQVGDDYDIFIGLMWGKFGSPTDKAGSGTEEEFLRAYSKYKAQPNALKIMFYFKNEPISPDDIDPEQLVKIREFKKSLGEKGNYYWSYNESSQFEELLRMHLIKVIYDISKNEGEQESNKPSINEDEIEEMGLLESIEIVQESMGEIDKVLAKITNYTYDITAKNKEKTSMLNAIASRSTSSTATYKNVIDSIALDLNNFSDRIKVEIPIFKEQFAIAMNAYRNAIIIYNQFPENSVDIGSLKESLRSLKDSASSNVQSQLSFADSIMSLPSMTTKLSKAKTNTSSVLKDFSKESEIATQLVEEVLKLW